MKSFDASLNSKQLMEFATQKALEKKAEDIVLFNPGQSSSIAEWIFICQGSTIVQNRAIADAIVQGLKKIGSPPWNVEGFDSARWVLIDCSDAIINIMLPEQRSYYNLESIWVDYPMKRVESEQKFTGF